MRDSRGKKKAHDMVYGPLMPSSSFILFFFVMDTAIKTVEDFYQWFKGSFETVAIPDFLNLHLIDAPEKPLPFNIIGSFIFKTPLIVQGARRYFLLSDDDGQLYQDKHYNENYAIVTIAESLEQRWSLDCVKLVDLSLPRSHGFSKRQFNVARTKQQYYG